MTMFYLLDDKGVIYIHEPQPGGGDIADGLSF